MDKLRNAKELSELLGIAPRTLRLWTREGIVPAIKIRSNVIRYDLDAVLDALKKRQGGSQ